MSFETNVLSLLFHARFLYSNGENALIGGGALVMTGFWVLVFFPTTGFCSSPLIFHPSSVEESNSDILWL